MADLSNNNQQVNFNINFDTEAGPPKQDAPPQMAPNQGNQQPIGVIPNQQPMGVVQNQQPMGVIQQPMGVQMQMGGVQMQMGVQMPRPMVQPGVVHMQQPMGMVQPGVVNFAQQPGAIVQIQQQPIAVVQPQVAKVGLQQPLLVAEVPPGGYSLQYEVQMPAAANQKVARVSQKQDTMHLRSLFLTIAVWGFLAFALASTRDSQTFAFILLGISVLCYYIDCCCAGTGKFVSNDMKPQEIGRFLDAIMASRGIVTFHVVCYHYETRHRTVYSRDSNGNQTSRVETYTEKVVTHTASDLFRYGQCIDNTGMVAVEIKHLTRLHLNKRFEFADHATANEFHRQKQYFKNFNKRDVHQDYHETFDIPGFQERFLVVPHGVQVPCCMSFGWYFLVSLMGFSWFYRMWFQKATEGKEMTILKKFKV